VAFQLDPRELVTAPFRSCPNCTADEFGVYAIWSQSYSRRCRKCWSKGDFPLWPLSRKVVYIDQFAISNMVKALNPACRSHKAAAADPFWLTLFERLERVVKLQLVICPYSDVHRHESMVSGFFEPLRRMYEQLSQGVYFESTDEIALGQLHTALLAWLNHEPARYDFDAETVTRGGLNDWKERFIISTSDEAPPFVVDGIRRFRHSVHAKLRVLFDRELRTTKQTGFEYWFARERKAGGRAILQADLLRRQRFKEMATGTVPFSPENFYESHALDQLNLVVDVLRSRGAADSELQSRVLAFLDSEPFNNYPASHIATLAWAAFSRAASNGQKEPPNQGMANDIRVLTLLPYCDAMFVDNGCRALWEKVPRSYRMIYRAKIFSPKTREEFLAYLHRIEEDADPGVIASAREVYGEPEPFRTIYADPWWPSGTAR
jgi:hypothetical protein